LEQTAQIQFFHRSLRQGAVGGREDSRPKQEALVVRVVVAVIKEQVAMEQLVKGMLEAVLLALIPPLVVVVAQGRQEQMECLAQAYLGMAAMVLHPQ
jgi:hypothetical protein